MDNGLLDGLGRKIAVVAAQTRLDEAATQMVAQALRAEGAEVVALPPRAGLPRALGGFQPETIIVIGLDATQGTATDLLVRQIRRRLPGVRIGSATVLARELRQEGVRTKRGKLVDKGYLYKLLNNRTYLGLAVHKDAEYPGEHAAIVPRDLWDKVHAILAENVRTRSANTRAQTPALLKGLISTAIGLLITVIGTDPIGSVHRFTFGSEFIGGGFPFLPVLIGIFAFAQIMTDIEKMGDARTAATTVIRSTFERFSHWKVNLEIFFRPVLLLGGDQYAKLESWHRWREVLELAEIAVFARPGFAAGDARARVVPFAPLAISASEIRARLARGEDVSAMVPAKVLA